MDVQDSPSALVPNPAAVVELVAQLLEGRWPRSGQDRLLFFRRLSLVGGAPWAVDDPQAPTTHFALTLPFPGVPAASWTALQGKFLGISLQPYTAPLANNPLTLLGYQTLKAQLSELLGEPTRPWQDPAIAACVWHRNGRRISLRYFHLLHSGLMLSVDDAGLAAVAALP